VGLAPGNTFNTPAIHADIAKALSLFAVHTNRVLQDLRLGRLIT
jgi:hypothetical protein